MSTRAQTAHVHSAQFDPLPLVPGSGDVSTQTIDLDSLFAADVHPTGTFDLSGIESTSLGKLLNVLPIPAMLIDNWYSLVFANQSCAKLGTGYSTAVPSSFPDLFSLPRDPERAKTVRDSALALMERAFSTRKPEVAEAILEIDEVRLWARLHLRSVKISSERYVLVVIEDVTSEKTQCKLSEREERRLRRVHQKLAMSVHDLSQNLQETEEKLRKITELYVESREQLRLQRQKT